MRNFIFPILLMALAGCDTTSHEIQREQAEQRQTLMQLQEKQEALNANLRNTQEENERLTKQIEEMRAELEAGRQTTEGYARDIARLDELAQKMNSAREKDRQVILDEVSGELARISQKIAQPPSPKTTKSEVGYEHTVKKGETLFAIAKAYNVSATAIRKANRLKEGDALKVGQVLFIPKK